MATKRNLDETVDDNGQKKLKAGTDEGEDAVIECRVLIDNHEAGIIIGKAGSNVTNIRKESGAFLSILKNETQTKERVLNVKGTTDAITKAFGLIMQLLMDAATARAQNNDPTAPAPDSHPLKILIHKFLAGSVIGKGGSIIKQIMTETGCRLQLSNEPLGASTEKTVTVSGEPDAARKGIKRVLDQIRDNPLRGGSTTILYVPGAAMAYAAPVNPYAQYAPPAQQMYAQQPSYGAPAYGAPAPQASYAPALSMSQPIPGAPGQKTEKIVIPTVCTGSVIGKNGTIIRDIKMQSGTFISISDPEPTAPSDRVVSVTGSAQGIQTAIFLIRQRVESYQPPGMAAAAASMGYQ
jgi:ribosomal protein S3